MNFSGFSSMGSPPQLPHPNTSPNTPFIPPSPFSRPRAMSEVPSVPSLEVNQPFVRPASVKHTSHTYAPPPFNSAKPNHQFSQPQTSGPSNQTENTVDSGVNTPFHRPGSTVPDRPIKVERYTPSPKIRPLEASSTSSFQHTNLNAVAMLPPPVLARPSAIALGKRKAESELPEQIFNSPVWNDSPSYVKREREQSSNSDIKPNIPIPILPIPLPSKRFKKHSTAKALLIPVEQLPVFALPPMPPIEDPELLKQVFTHQSLFERSKGKFEDPIDNMSKHYEKLEHVGDSILGVVVTTWLHESRPNLTIGTATKLKAHLVSNATLSHLSGLYNLPQRLNGHPELLPVLRAQTDVRAALMEAYIAGLYFSFPIESRLGGEGIKVIDSWLREMYEPLYDFFYNYMKKEYEQHHLTIGSNLNGTAIYFQGDEKEFEKVNEQSTGMSNLVAMYCSDKEKELYWQEEKLKTNQGFLWKIKCLVDGIELSEAIRPYRKLARNVAGYEAAKKLGLACDT